MAARREVGFPPSLGHARCHLHEITPAFPSSSMNRGIDAQRTHCVSVLPSDLQHK